MTPIKSNFNPFTIQIQSPNLGINWWNGINWSQLHSDHAVLNVNYGGNWDWALHLKYPTFITITITISWWHTITPSQCHWMYLFYYFVKWFIMSHKYMQVSKILTSFQNNTASLSSLLAASFFNFDCILLLAMVAKCSDCLIILFSCCLVNNVLSSSQTDNFNIAHIVQTQRRSLLM